MVERPHSVSNSTEIALWDFGTLEEWHHFSPHTVIEESHFNANPADIYDLPQLRGRRFSRDNRFRDVSSLTIASPLVSTRVMEEISARTGDLSTASSEITALVSSTCNRSFGFPCQQCTGARAILAIQPIPRAPANPPPRLNRVASIPENAPFCARVRGCFPLRYQHCAKRSSYL